MKKIDQHANVVYASMHSTMKTSIPISELGMEVNDELLLGSAEEATLEVRTEVVSPPQPAALAAAPQARLPAHLVLIPFPVAPHMADQLLVFLGRPRAFLQASVLLPRCLLLLYGSLRAPFITRHTNSNKAYVAVTRPPSQVAARHLGCAPVSGLSPPLPSLPRVCTGRRGGERQMISPLELAHYRRMGKEEIKEK